jgi:hypothetical protein
MSDENDDGLSFKPYETIPERVLAYQWDGESCPPGAKLIYHEASSWSGAAPYSQLKVQINKKHMSHVIYLCKGEWLVIPDTGTEYSRAFRVSEEEFPKRYRRPGQSGPYYYETVATEEPKD